MGDWRMAKNNEQPANRKNGLIARFRDAPPHIAVPVGAGLIIGGTLLSPLPFFGLWMAPVGLAILAPHWRAADRLSRRLLRWSIKNGFVRIKRTPRQGKEEPPATEG
ncbi:hypothetical protein SS37A_18140 [Methylocystis iwaonis]|uniref:Uncharacterized protein n=2 Tax=Methylocystis iwaonis TaxID=2885079 RepID=A0ABM8E8J7_9HYPH|nr:hypothetical protein SS37A_18140 [Methylocystis iwaonis]